MPTLYEYYTTAPDSYTAVYDVNWSAQTFTPAIAHTITSVKLKLFRTAGGPGVITVSIKATDGTYPTGGDLCSGTTDGNTLPTASPGEWREITLGAGSILSAGVKYAIVVRALTADSFNYLKWEVNSAAGYAAGAWVRSLDSGINWSIPGAYDCMFEDWGEPLPKLAGSIVPKMVAMRMI